MYTTEQEKQQGITEQRRARARKGNLPDVLWLAGRVEIRTTTFTSPSELDLFVHEIQEARAGAFQ